MPPGEAVEALKQAIAAALERASEKLADYEEGEALINAFSTRPPLRRRRSRTDPQKDAFDALFGGGYAMPNDDD